MGRLDPAGVDLQARGFREYLRNLEQIEKKQRAVFDQKFKGTERSFSQIQQAAKAYERQLERTRQQQERFRREQERTASAQRKAAAAQRAQAAAQRRQAAGGILQVGGGRLGGLAGGLAGGAALGGIAAIAQATIELKAFSKESAIIADSFNTQERALQNTAAAYGQSSTLIVDAIRRASQGVLSEVEIVNQANRALLLGVADTPEEFERVTRAAIVLGRTVGIEGPQAIERFVFALGRQSTDRLDDFALGADEVNAAISRIAQRDFGKPFEELSEAQQKAVFLEGALTLADEKLEAIGDAATGANSAFAELQTSADNLQLAFGQLTLPFEQGLARAKTELNETLALLIQTIGGFGGIDTEIATVNKELERAIAIRDELAAGESVGARIAQFFGTADESARQLDEQIAELEEQLAGLEAQKVAEIADEMENASDKTKEFNEEIEETERDLKALQSVLDQAERLQISFARAAEDATRKLERQQAKLARTQGREQTKLRQQQQKERDKFLNRQGEEFEKFNADLLKEVQDTEAKLNDAREKAGRERLREDQRLKQELRQAEERFNLSREQARRRFELDDRRLRAEGDILALQELRENNALEVQENQENFDLSQRQRKDDGREQQKERDRQRRESIQALEQELSDLQDNLASKQNAFLVEQDEEFKELVRAQQEQRDAQLIAQRQQRDDLDQSLREQQEDRRINQARQLEDLGRSLQDQEDLTEEGAKNIADELEKIFGIDGAADTIFQGFSDRTESEFRDLFDKVAQITSSIPLSLGRGGGSSLTPRGGRSSVDRPLQFQEGGVVPGPIGAPQAAIVHGGETVLPTHRMTAPVIPAQNVNVSMSGGFNISGGEGAGEASVQAALDEMTTSFEVAVRRLIRKG